MRLKFALLSLVVVLSLGVSLAVAETEQEVINRYLQKTVAKHTTKLSWISFSVSMDRINRHNDYNDFAIIESAKLGSGEFSWIRQGFSVGADFGLMVHKRFAWSLGGEYWLKLGNNLPTGNTYLQLSTNTVVPADPKSELKVFGFTTSLQYYLINPPVASAKQNAYSVRVGGSVGYYSASWDLWPEYENLNLATAVPVGTNSTYKGTAPGFSFGMGVDYPLGWWDLGLAVDASYLYLNFGNVSWYNSNDEEIVASLDGTENGRVDLALSGVRGRIEIKRYFNW
ncbi:MAG: hypothetical protein AB1772_04960 [Candidatus Zixiibacteriota bacterium]